MEREKHFWNGYYSQCISGDNELVKFPSNFALFCSKFIRKNDVVLDVGCGNGRDSLYMSTIAKKVFSLDTSQKACENLQGYDNIVVICKSMGELENLMVDVVYSRFSLHSVDKETQDKFFKYLKDNVQLVCIETRSVNDPRCGVGEPGTDEYSFVDTHYRRFTKLCDITGELISRGFQIVHAEEDHVNAVMKHDRAVVNRIIAKRV